jgi:hypothetical protein
VWVSPGAGEYNYSTNKGIRIETKPAENLNAGVFFNFGEGSFGPITLSQWFNETAFGASYSKNKYDWAAGLKLASDRYPGNEDRAKAYFGVRYWGIPDLTITMDVQFENLGDFSGKGVLRLNEKTWYRIKTLTAGITFSQAVFYSIDNESGDEKHSYYFKYTPFFEYGINNYFRGGMEMPFDFQEKEGLKFRTLTVNPYLYYSIGGVWLKLNYVATYIGRDFTGGDAVLDHKIAMVCVYYF